MSQRGKKNAKFSPPIFSLNISPWMRRDIWTSKLDGTATIRRGSRQCCQSLARK
jgi:hypothetical protein